jgi:Ca2+-binding RTX toxin-like protein
MAIVEGTEASELINQLDGVTNSNDRIYGYGGMDTIYGFDGDDEIYGGEGDDSIYGFADNDVLKGGGGADHLYGGPGTDWASYLDAPTGVTVSLYPWGGEGTGFAAGDTFDNIENLSGSIYGDFLSGDDGVNTLAGQDGNDWLQGRDGADRLEGGTGTYDTASYYVSPVGVFVSLVTGMGFNGHAEGDRLNGIENLAGSGSRDDLLVGNDTGNSLWGNGGNDNLKGGGGVDVLSGALGDDTLDGGTGRDWLYGGPDNDTYIVDDAFDHAVESGGEGSDTVRASVSYTLFAGEDIEFLTTTSDTGTAAINLTGNNTTNVVRGNNGNNTLNGGDGNDELNGLGGQDWFLFNTPLNATLNVDRIVNFNVTDDTIRLDATIFSSGLTPDNSVGGSQFYVGAAAEDAGDRIIYNNATGAVYYDSDGTGTNAQIQFAQLDAGLADPTDINPLTHFDFFVVA